ncbi:MAG TPA: FG-GAP-like repeat-containing protein [Pyrinomonadaceae bacterium]|nr:FG-GAP-like repeat-containing protein [Pyrinomonadaceae bacterium]
MKTHKHIAAVAALCALAVSSAFWPRPSDASRAQSAAADAREEAYRANNMGVALLEQFKHREGADAFRRALKLDPRLTIARVNLAIALFNVPDLPGARREAAAAAQADPRAPQPHYVLGLVARTENLADEALTHFRKVLALDARDTGANVQVGQLLSQQRKYAEAVAAFRVALDEEPYNGTALYGLATALLRSGQREEGQRLMTRFQELRQSGAATTIGQNYLEQGRYAEAVASTGAEAGLVNKAAPEVAFVDASSAALPSTPGAGADSEVPSLFGQPIVSDAASEMRVWLMLATPGGVTLFDFDADGDLDLFATLAGGHLLYRNDAGKFTDVTAASGALAKPGPANGVAAVAGDYDNDERADLLVLRAGALSLYRNEGGGRFADATSAAQIPAYPYATVSAALVDADHDGDLDIFVAGLANPSKRKAAAASAQTLNFPLDFEGAPNLLLRNNGDGKFTDITAKAGVAGGASNYATSVVPTDYDNRRDVDLLVAQFNARPALYKNLRDGTFKDVAAEVGLSDAGAATSVAAGDFNKDGFTDFFFAAPDSAGRFAASDGRGRFRLSAAPSSDVTAAQQASRPASQFLDYDNDGLLDLVSVSASTAGGRLRVLRNVGDGWDAQSERAAGKLFAAAQNAPAAPRHLAAADLDADGDTDLILRRAGGALLFARNEGGSRNRSVRLRLAGKVSNRGGVGAKIEARAGSLMQKLETYAATPAPAPSDVVFGLGSRQAADAVRVIWPAGVVQAETESAGATPKPQGATMTVTELDRKPSSCPYLFTWNGERYEFVTDFMGGGELGYWVAPGVRAAPDPDEYVRIRAEQLKEREGRFEIRVTNELEEVLFMDRLQLLAVAHPVGVEVFPNEGLGNPTSATSKLYAARDLRPPVAAADDAGRDVLARLTKLDRSYPDGFRLRPIRGYADEHALTLDLGRATDATRALLLLTGWTDYAFSSDNVAASQAGMSLRPPALQVRDREGKWRTVIEGIGIPVGRPQTVAVDLSNKFLSESREVRVVTNMRIYWDQALVAESDTRLSPRVERLEASRADLSWRGFSAETTPDGREPYGYDYARVSYTSPWKTMTGRYTREGDVRPLLLATDDMFVVSRPGDEMAVSFDARRLAPLPPGWTRTFLLYADGFSKEMDINSASPDAVAPLPFHAMKSYPYAAPESYPSTPAHRAYVEQYNTRLVASPVRQLAGGAFGLRP